MSRQPTQSDVDLATTLLTAGRAEDQVIAALVYRGLDRPSAARLVGEIRIGNTGPEQKGGLARVMDWCKRLFGGRARARAEALKELADQLSRGESDLGQGQTFAALDEEIARLLSTLRSFAYDAETEALTTRAAKFRAGYAAVSSVGREFGRLASDLKSTFAEAVERTTDPDRQSQAVGSISQALAQLEIRVAESLAAIDPMSEADADRGRRIQLNRVQEALAGLKRRVEEWQEREKQERVLRKAVADQLARWESDLGQGQTFAALEEEIARLGSTLRSLAHNAETGALITRAAKFRADYAAVSSVGREFGHFASDLESRFVQALERTTDPDWRSQGIGSIAQDLAQLEIRVSASLAAVNPMSAAVADKGRRIQFNRVQEALAGLKLRVEEWQEREKQERVLRQAATEITRWESDLGQGRLWVGQDEAISKLVTTLGTLNGAEAKALRSRADKFQTDYLAVSSIYREYESTAYDLEYRFTQATDRTADPVRRWSAVRRIADDLAQLEVRVADSLGALFSENEAAVDRGRRIRLSGVQRHLARLKPLVQEWQGKEERERDLFQPTPAEETMTERMLDAWASLRFIVEFPQPGTVARRVRGADWDAAGRILEHYAQSLHNPHGCGREEMAKIARAIIEVVQGWTALAPPVKAMLLAHLFLTRGWLGDEGIRVILLAVVDPETQIHVTGHVANLSTPTSNGAGILAISDLLRRFFQIFHHTFVVYHGLVLLGRVRKYVPVDWQGPKRISHIVPIHTNQEGGFSAGCITDEVFVVLNLRAVDSRLVGRHEFQHLVDTALAAGHEPKIELWEMEYLAYLGTAITVARWIQADEDNRLDTWELFEQIFGPKDFLRPYLEAKKRGERIEEHVVGADSAVREFIAELVGRGYRDATMESLLAAFRQQGRTPAEAQEDLVAYLRDLPWRPLGGYLNVTQRIFGAEAAKAEALVRNLMESFYCKKFGAVPAPVLDLLNGLDVADIAPVDVIAPDGSWTDTSKGHEKEIEDLLRRLREQRCSSSAAATKGGPETAGDKP